MIPEPGMVLWVALGSRLPPGHEQNGERPALVVGVPAKLGVPRFPMLLVAPITSFVEQSWALRSPELYPIMQAGSASLPRASIILLDQLQSIDIRRVLRFFGTLSKQQYHLIADSLKTMLSAQAGQ